MTTVKFLIEKPEGDLPYDVFAFFPELAHNNTDITTFTSYAHIGQHSACCLDYANACKEANFNEYWDLMRELIGQGYNDLVIINKQEINCHRPPTKGEIKFGEGATHYRDFTLAEIGITKKGEIKKWFIAPNDKLRYYTR